MNKDYLNILRDQLDKLEQTQEAAIDQVAKVCADAIEQGGLLYFFGTGHAHMLCEEPFYRAGGLACVSPILEPSLMLHQGGAKSSALERLPQLGSTVVAESGVGEKDVLFIDEIHRLSRNVEEVLYSAMEDFALDIVIGKGPSARSIRLDLAPFTLIGATTKAGSLAGPLRDRFGVISRLEYYQPEDLVLIVKRAAEILQIPIEEKGAWEIARRSRGTPRIANRLLKRVRDFAQITGDGIITDEIADASLQRLEVDKMGLDHTDRRMLETMVMKFGGGPVGLDTLAAATSEERDTIEDVYEPYLLQLGFINRTPKGRVVTRAGYEHMNIPYPEA